MHFHNPGTKVISAKRRKGDGVPVPLGLIQGPEKQLSEAVSYRELKERGQDTSDWDFSQV